MVCSIDLLDCLELLTPFRLSHGDGAICILVLIWPPPRGVVALAQKFSWHGPNPSPRVSALHGTGVRLLMDDVDWAYANATRDLPTPILTRLLKSALTEHQPRLIRGRRIKLRYAHQGGTIPPSS